MISSRDAILMSLTVILWVAACLSMVSACQCDRNTTTVKAAYCSSKYAFKGTVLAENRVITPTSTMKREESNPVLHSSPDIHDVEQMKYPDTEIKEYHILLETEYKGIDEKFVGQILVIYNDDLECGQVSLEVGNTYVFQLDILKSLDICDRVDRFGDISKTERRGLRTNYSRTCKYQLQKRNEDERLKDALYLYPLDNANHVKSEDNVEQEERGNYWQTVGKQPQPTTKWDKKCKCYRPVLRNTKTGNKSKKKDTK